MDKGEIVMRCAFCGGYVLVPLGVFRSRPHDQVEHPSKAECAMWLKRAVEELQAQLGLMRLLEEAQGEKSAGEIELAA